MEALRKVAKAYYDSGTNEERVLFQEFFRSMDKDGNGRVSYEEFSDFMSQKAHDENMRTRDFFKKLDINGSRGLDSKELLTLYYILKSGRPICGRCKTFVTNEYFTCMKCFEPQTAAYSICLECFRDKGRLNHNHDRSYLVDNFSLLESLRKKPLPNHQPSGPSLRRSNSQVANPSQRRSEKSSSHLPIVPSNPNIPEKGSPSIRSSKIQVAAPSRPDHSGSPSNLPIVPYNPNIPGKRRGLWQKALKVFEAALPIAGIVAGCSIM